jgi:putative cell wall-binding protein
VPAATLQLLQDLGTTTITITGSTASVSAGIENQLTGLGYSVQRLGGANRYETSQLINHAFFSAVQPRAFISSGQNFPDALGGAALAASLNAPLFTAPQSCVPAGTVSELARLQTPRITLFGDTNALSTSVANAVSC